MKPQTEMTHKHPRESALKILEHRNNRQNHSMRISEIATLAQAYIDTEALLKKAYGKMHRYNYKMEKDYLIPSQFEDLVLEIEKHLGYDE
jgi:hypothetical protein